MTSRPCTVAVGPEALATATADRVRAGARFAGLWATARPGGATTVTTTLADHDGWTVITATLTAGADHYPSVAALVPAAAWYERECHDLFGLVPDGHPRLDPLVLPLRADQPRPRPGGGTDTGPLTPDDTPLPGRVTGEGVFTIPYGPVRSGVFESVEYLVETSGEEIHHLRIRVHHKHRGLDRRFLDLSVDDAVLLAERVEGTTSVAHAVAYSRAVEALAGTVVPLRAELLRVIHAELERVAVHLDSVVRQTEGAGQAVAYARLSSHKEAVLRLRGRLGGNRFGRGVVVPGGVSGPPRCDLGAARTDIARLARAVAGDTRALMATPSFLDRLRTTGVLDASLARAHGALGPVARGSGVVEDTRTARPYGAYPSLGVDVVSGVEGGDALARQEVREREVAESFRLATAALDALESEPPGPWRTEAVPGDGLAVAGVEAPQGELLYLVEFAAGRAVRVKPRCASFHNLSLMARTFRGDIFTDFVFIEASFGLSIAGVAG